MSKLEEFRQLYRKFRVGMLKLVAARQKGVTPFYSKELARFEREDRDPMDAAWKSLPPTERGMFLDDDIKATRAIFPNGSHK